MTLGRIMGLDYGTRRIGVAMSDALHLIARPFAVLEANTDRLRSEVRSLAEEHEVELIVVGLPVNLSGGDTPSTIGARQLASLVADATGLPVKLSDERYTTKTAEQVLIGANVRREDRKQVIDKVAAAVMLQHYLDGL
jgi:putative Holliday junction resolvase